MIIHDAHQLAVWDHTAQTSYMIGVLTTVVISAVSKSKPKPYSMTHYHPYRKSKKTGHQIRQDNFQVLRMIGDAIVAGKK